VAVCSDLYFPCLSPCSVVCAAAERAVSTLQQPIELLLCNLCSLQVCCSTPSCGGAAPASSGSGVQRSASEGDSSRLSPARLGTRRCAQLLAAAGCSWGPEGLATSLTFTAKKANLNAFAVVQYLSFKTAHCSLCQTFVFIYYKVNICQFALKVGILS